MSRVLADQVTRWCLDWAEAADGGLVEGLFGADFRAGLERFLALSEEQRTWWLARPVQWRVRREELEAPVAVPVPSTREERQRAEVVAVAREWVAACVEVVGEGAAGGEATAADLVVSLNVWLMFTGRAELPGSKALLREVLAAQVKAAVGHYDRKAKVWRGVRLV